MDLLYNTCAWVFYMNKSKLVHSSLFWNKILTRQYKTNTIDIHANKPGAPYLATDWMTLEEVSLMLVRKRSVPPLKISKSPLPDWSGSYTPTGEK